MASVRKRQWTNPKTGEASFAWQVSYTDEVGARRTKSFAKKKDADHYRSTVEYELRDRTHTAESRTMKVAEAAEDFLRDCERRRRIGDRMAGATLVGYSGVIRRHIKPALGHLLLTEVTSPRVQMFIDKISATLDRNTVKGIYLVLHSILKFSVRRGWIKRNILRDNPVSLPAGAKRRVYMPSKSELMSLLKASETRVPGGQFTCYVNLFALVRLGIFGGLRAGEMRGLHWEDIDIAGGVINIRRSLSAIDGLKAPKTEAGNRAVPLTRPIMDGLEMIARYWRAKQEADRQAGEDGLSDKRAAKIERKITLFRRGEHVDLSGFTGFVLRNEQGGAIDESSYRGAFSSLMERAGLSEGGRSRFTLHALRHAAASLFIEAGLPAMNLKAVIGHASVTTTYNVYGHLFPEDERIALAAQRIAESGLTGNNSRQIGLTR